MNKKFQFPFLLLFFFSTMHSRFFRIQFMKRITATAIAAWRHMPKPQRQPTAALHQMVAALFSPWMDKPSFMMTPAPKKPTPVTTCDSTRKLSLFTGPPLCAEACITLSDSSMNMHAPTATNALTAKPALRWRSWRSTPMTMPATKAHSRRFKNTSSGINTLSICSSVRYQKARRALPLVPTPSVCPNVRPRQPQSRLLPLWLRNGRRPHAAFRGLSRHGSC